MNKIIFVLILLLTFSLVGCSRQPEQDQQRADSSPNRWGVTLETDKVTNKSLTLNCNHSGGEDVAQLTTGTYFVIQKMKDNTWVDVEFAPHPYEIAWDLVAWIIQKESTTTWEVDWEWLYGELPAGKYRIGKEIMNFRGTGDYDKEMVYGEFVIK